VANLENAIRLAVRAHQDQVDKAGEPYILHPLRVMLSLNSDSERIVGVLHDVIEDSTYTLIDLQKMGYSSEILNALDYLTKRANEPYEQFIERIKGNPIARRVKKSDLEDNMDIRRIARLTAKDFERLRRYREAWSKL
jgi:(p)ppGpp synthase/HD superfamily hydrolase